jgi:hypothetical protein
MTRQAKGAAARQVIRPRLLFNEDEYDADEELASPPADPRRQGPLYVEARGYLQPAVDFYARAVRSADALGSTTGEILASVCFVLAFDLHHWYHFSYLIGC